MKPRIYFATFTKIWILQYNYNNYGCLTWEEAVLTLKKIWFERIIPLLSNNLILIGHSLGGIFLAKYLSENKFPKKLRGAFLVSAPYDDETQDSLGDFRLERSLEQLKNQVTDIYLYHSKDDDVVRFADFESYKKELPNAHAEAFEDRGHINQEKFPELIRDIKKVFA